MPNSRRTELPFPVMHCPDAVLAGRVGRVLRRVPELAGAPIRIEWRPGLRDRRGEVHAGSFLRERRIAFNCTASEFARIFTHELFHFVWLRLGNARRRAFEDLLRAERSRGELGWSAEWRRAALRPLDIETRSRAWREYCCESFCDTAAWLYSGVRSHEEFTLGHRWRERRREWFRRTLETRPLPV